MSEIRYPRVACVIRETGQISSIAVRSGPPPDPDKRQAKRDDFYYVEAPGHARVGMIYNPADGTAAFGPEHEDSRTAEWSAQARARQLEQGPKPQDAA